MILRLWPGYALALMLASIAMPVTRAWSDAYYLTTANEVTVISDASAKRCSRIASQFLRLDALARDIAGWDADERLPPVKVYLLAPRDGMLLLNDADRKKLEQTGNGVYSRYLSSRDFDIAAMRDEEVYETWMQSLFLLRAQRLLVTGASRSYPAWYLIGLSDLLNGLVIKDDGTVLLSRKSAFAPQGTPGGGPRPDFSLPKLLDTMHTDSFWTQQQWQEFYARARDWATYGILTTPERKQHFRELALLMSQGATAEDAVKEAFGMPLTELTTLYAGNEWRKDVQYRLPPSATIVAIPEPARLTVDEANEHIMALSQRVLAASAH